jgi:hypothetical protein
MSAITAEMEMELESELTHEAHEHEFEAHEHEFEYEHEHEAHEHEFEHEHEHESEMEQESFFNHLAAMADRGGRSQALRRVALAAARQALRSYRSTPPTIEGEFESHEASFELEAEASPLRAEHANAIMEHMSHEAVTAESEQEAAEQFLPLIPLAAKVVLPMAAKLGAKMLPVIARKVAPRIMSRVVPHLTRGVSQVAKTLFRSPATRPLLRAVPNIAKRTVANIARVVARGRPITPQTALRILARQTARTLSSPRQAVTAFRRSRALDRRYHRVARSLTGHPVSRGRPWMWRRPWTWRRRPYYYRRPGYWAPGGVAPQPVYGTVPVAGTYVPQAVAVPSVAPAGVVPAAVPPCQCFRPVSCLSCGR